MGLFWQVIRMTKKGFRHGIDPDTVLSGRKSRMRFLLSFLVYPHRQVFELNSTTSCSRSPRRLNGTFGPFKGQCSKFKVGNGVRCTSRSWARRFADGLGSRSVPAMTFSPAEEFSERDNAIAYQFRVLDEIGGVADRTRDQDLPRRQFTSRQTLYSCS